MSGQDFREALAQRLLTDPAFLSDKSAAERQEFLDDPALMQEAMSEEASSVLTLGWDGDFPGGSGVVTIREWKGTYFISSSDYDDLGPYSSIDEALANEVFHCPTSHAELYSSIVSLDRLMEIGVHLVGDGEPYSVIRINDQDYTLTSEGLRRV